MDTLEISRFMIYTHKCNNVIYLDGIIIIFIVTVSLTDNGHVCGNLHFIWASRYFLLFSEMW